MTVCIIKQYEIKQAIFWGEFTKAANFSKPILAPGPIKDNIDSIDLLKNLLLTTTAMQSLFIQYYTLG